MGTYFRPNFASGVPGTIKNHNFRFDGARSSILRTILTSQIGHKAIRTRYMLLSACSELFPVLQVYFRSETQVTKSTADALGDIF